MATFREQELDFYNDYIRLAGTLLLPESPGPPPQWFLYTAPVEGSAANTCQKLSPS